MASDQDFADSYSFDKGASSFIEELEAKMRDTLEKKRNDLEYELEERIRLEKEEAHKKIDQLESELKGNQEALVQYKSILTKLKADKEGIKSEIHDRFNKAAQIQKEIEEKTSQSLEELSAVSELFKDLDEIKQNTLTKVHSLRSELESKYGIETQNIEMNGPDEIEVDFKSMLARLIKVKELMASQEDAHAKESEQD